MTAITVNARCMTPTCAWVGRVREVRLDAIGVGQGLHGMMRLVCECGSEPEVEVLGARYRTTAAARVPFKQP